MLGVFNFLMVVFCSLGGFLCEAKGSTSFTVDLGNVCQDMWNSAGDNLKIGQEIVIYTGSNPHPLITLTELGKKKLQRSIFMRFKALLDNYVADEDLPEQTSSAELQEEDAFINAVAVSGGPMEIAFKYLRDKGKISLKCLDDFKPILKKMWFGKYAKRGRGTHFSGFEHTFVGEIVYDWKTKSNKTTGFHNWIQFLSEIEAGRITYYPPPKGKIVNSELALVWANLRWRGARKPPGASFFIGTSPAFEMALYTSCFFQSDQSSQCTCRINGEPLAVTAVNLNGKGYVLTAYPRL